MVGFVLGQMLYLLPLMSMRLLLLPLLLQVEVQFPSTLALVAHADVEAAAEQR